MSVTNKNIFDWKTNFGEKYLEFLKNVGTKTVFGKRFFIRKKLATIRKIENRQNEDITLLRKFIRNNDYN